MRIASKCFLALSLLILSTAFLASAQQTDTKLSFQLETTLQCPVPVTPNTTRTIAWSDDQAVIAFDVISATSPGDWVCVYDTANLAAPPRIIEGGIEVISAGGYLLTHSLHTNNSDVRWFDVRTDADPLPDLKGLYSSAYFTFSHNGKYIFTNGGATGVRLWDAQTKNLLVHSDLGTVTTGAAFNRDDTRLAMMGQTGLEVWTVYPGPLMTQDKIIHRYGDSLSYYVVIGGRDGNLVAFTDGRTHMNLYDLSTDQQREPLETTDFIVDYTFDQTGLLLAAASLNGTRIWDVENRTLLADLSDNPAARNYKGGVAFRPDGAQIAIGRADGRIEIYNINSQKDA